MAKQPKTARIQNVFAGRKSLTVITRSGKPFEIARRQIRSADADVLGGTHYQSLKKKGWLREVPVREPKKSATPPPEAPPKEQPAGSKLPESSETPKASSSSRSSRSSKKAEASKASKAPKSAERSSDSKGGKS